MSPSIHDGMAEEMARVVAAGARVRAEMTEGRSTWTVMEDPEGNEFCVEGGPS